MCKVTVITVAYNAEDCIKGTIYSVLAQKYRDFEYIIKDGDSTDATNDIVNESIKSISRENILVRHIKSKDKGIYDAMNEAVQYASGEWIIFMNAGDVFYDANVLSNVFSMQYEKCVGVLYGHVMLNLMRNRNIILTYNLNYMKKGYSICHQAVFEKRIYLVGHPFDNKLKILGDRDHLLYLMNKGIEFQKINIIVAKEDRNGISSVNYPQFFKESNMIHKKYNLNCKKQSIQIGKLKMLIRKLIPWIEECVMINKVLKRVD